MKDTLSIYLEKASCFMGCCPYENHCDCDDCIKRMVKEHDAKVRADAEKELKNKYIKKYLDVDAYNVGFTDSEEENIKEIRKIMKWYRKKNKEISDVKISKVLYDFEDLIRKNRDRICLKKKK